MGRFLIIKTLLVGFVLVLGFGLRYKNYSQVPFPGESQDEYSFSWVGLSLIEVGVPVGANGVGGYQNRIFKYVNPDRIFQTGMYSDPIEINYPWFDHPPLLGVITGGYAYTSGARVFEDTAAFVIRKPMIAIGTVAVGLVFLLGSTVYGFWPGLIAAAVYAASPLVAVASRMVQAENLLLVWFLSGLWGLMKYEAGGERKWIVWVGVMSGLAMWTKMSGVTIILLALFILRAKRKDLVAYMLSLAPFLAGLGVYALAYGWETYLRVFTANSQRVYGLGAQAVFELLTKHRITHTKFLTDGWILAGWMGLGLVKEEKQGKTLVLFAILYMIFYLLLGNYPYGWYALPFWPVLFIFLGKGIWEGIINRSRSWWTIIFLMLPLGIGVDRVLGYDNVQKTASVWRFGVPLILLLTVLGLVLKDRKFRNLSGFAVASVLVAALVFSSLFILNLNVDAWYKVN